MGRKTHMRSTLWPQKLGHAVGDSISRGTPCHEAKPQKKTFFFHETLEGQSGRKQIKKEKSSLFLGTQTLQSTLGPKPLQVQKQCYRLNNINPSILREVILVTRKTSRCIRIASLLLASPPSRMSRRRTWTVILLEAAERQASTTCTRAVKGLPSTAIARVGKIFRRKPPMPREEGAPNPSETQAVPESMLGLRWVWGVPLGTSPRLVEAPAHPPGMLASKMHDPC